MASQKLLHSHHDTLHVEEFSHTRLSRCGSQKMQSSASIWQAKQGLTDTPFFSQSNGKLKIYLRRTNEGQESDVWPIHYHIIPWYVHACALHICNK